MTPSTTQFITLTLARYAMRHSYGNANGEVQGDFHDHENSYKFSDDNHNQKLSDYYLKLHDTNNPDNFNERGELYFDHGLHTPDYVVTPIVQSNGKSVGKGDESTPDAIVPVGHTYTPTMLRITYLSYTAPVLTLRFKAIVDQTRVNYLVIRVDGQDWTTPALFFGRYHLLSDATREVSLSAHGNGKSVILTRMPYVQIINGKAYPQVERSAGHAYGWLSITDFDMRDFRVQLRNYASETVTETT